jgi:hypothetical protein
MRDYSLSSQVLHNSSRYDHSKQLPRISPTLVTNVLLPDKEDSYARNHLGWNSRHHVDTNPAYICLSERRSIHSPA